MKKYFFAAVMLVAVQSINLGIKDDSPIPAPVNPDFDDNRFLPSAASAKIVKYPDLVNTRME